MLDPENLVSIALAFFIVTVSPGPANIAVATVAMRSGRRCGLIFGAGLSFGLAFWGLIAATGMGALLQGSVSLLMVLKILGGLYLLWLAFRSARSALKESEPGHLIEKQGWWFMRGLVLNLSNPKAIVAWMAALSMGLGAGDSGGQIMVAMLVCVALGVGNYTGYAVAFSLPGFMNGYQHWRKRIDGTVAGLFSLAGIGLIRTAFHAE